MGRGIQKNKKLSSKQNLFSPSNNSVFLKEQQKEKEKFKKL